MRRETRALLSVGFILALCLVLWALEGLGKNSYKRLEAALNFLDNDLRPTRNRYVHDNYSFFTGENIRRIVRTKVVNVQAFQKQLITRTEHPVTASELVLFNEDLERCASYLAYRFIALLSDPDKANPQAIEAIHEVGDDYYSALSEVIAKYKSRTKAS